MAPERPIGPQRQKHVTRGCDSVQSSAARKRLATGENVGDTAAMKLLGTIAVYAIIAVVLGWGILLAVQGNFWLLAVGFLGYLTALVAIGCLPKQSH